MVRSSNFVSKTSRQYALYCHSHAAHRYRGLLSAAHAEVGGGRRVTDGYPTYGRCGSRSSCVSSRGAMLITENPQLTFGTQSCTEGIRRGGVTLLTPPIHAESNSSRGRRSSRQHNTALALITVPDFLTATPIWKIGHWQLRPSRTHAEYLTADDAGQMDPCMEDR